MPPSPPPNPAKPSVGEPGLVEAAVVPVVADGVADPCHIPPLKSTNPAPGTTDPRRLVLASLFPLFQPLAVEILRTRISYWPSVCLVRVSSGHATSRSRSSDTSLPILPFSLRTETPLPRRLRRPEPALNPEASSSWASLRSRSCRRPRKERKSTSAWARVVSRSICQSA